MADWSQIEVEVLISVYFDFLDKEVRGESVNKRAANLQLLPLLNNRSLGSVEFKHCNVSAVLLELGYPYVDGYKPRSNYQEILREVVEARMLANRTLQVAVKTVVDKPALQLTTSQKQAADLTKVIVAAPILDSSTKSKKQAPRKPQVRLGVNYLERESNNASLGQAGEQFVLEVEYARLWKSGKRSLADKIEHVSQTKGDGLGYDILSFEESGQERLIEVKTTRFGPLTPFFASRNEVRMSAELDNYQLYRVFRFDKEPKVFILPGSLKFSCRLEPTQYRASVA